MTTVTAIERDATLPALPAQRSLLRMRAHRLLQRKLAVIGAAIILFEMVAAILGPRLVSDARYSLLIRVVSVAIAIIAGVCLGIFSGYIGGAVDEVLMRILRSFMALPSLVLALAIAAALGTGLANA